MKTEKAKDIIAYVIVAMLIIVLLMNLGTILGLMILMVPVMLFLYAVFWAIWRLILIHEHNKEEAKWKQKK